MRLSQLFKRITHSVATLFPKKRVTPTLMVRFEDLKYISNYQMVIVANTVTIDLQEPLIDINLNLKDDLQKCSHLFPFVVGNNGNLISPKFGRRVKHHAEPQKTSIYLEYILDPVENTRLILRIIGKDPQSILIVQDERRNPELPVTLFMYKPSNLPQENRRGRIR